MTTPQIITYYGYPVETHRIVSEDGYILTIHRIPNGKNEIMDDDTKKNQSKPIIYLQHGFLGTSFEWFLNVKHNLLSLILVDAGYDVWIGNARGNTYSRGHVNLTVQNAKYWDFSFNEFGKYDIPAVIDYMLMTTGQSSIYYIGFSMGTTSYFVMMSHHPQYNTKIKLMIALAPVVYLKHVTGIPKLISIFTEIPIVKTLVQIFTNGELLPSWLLKILNLISTTFCSITFIAETICANISFLIFGWDLPQVQINQMPVFVGQSVNPTSTRTAYHFLQFIRNGIFCEYDFGPNENIKRYGKSTPNLYNLKNTTSPVALIYGLNDMVAPIIDLKRLQDELPNIVYQAPVAHKYWNHYDFHFAKDANILVHQNILKLLTQY